MRIILQRSDDDERVVIETTNIDNSEGIVAAGPFGKFPAHAALDSNGEKFYRAREEFFYDDGTEAWYDEDHQDYERVE
jgi:hypothetical protein